MEISVEPGKTYAVTTSGSCTVTDADGLELCTASSGSQSFFVATTPTVTTSDDNAKVSRANFSCALARQSAGGGASSELPPGYTRLEFLESTGTQYVDTGFLSRDFLNSELNVSVALTQQRGEAYIGTYHTGGYSLQFWLNRTNKNIGGVFFSKTTISRANTDFTKRFNFRLKKNFVSVNGERIEKDAPLIDEALINATSDKFFLFGRYDFSTAAATCYSIKMHFFQSQINGTLQADFLPALDPAGEPCLLDRVSKQVFKNSGSGRFIAGVAGVGELANILLALPYKEEAGSTLDVRLPDNANMAEAQRIAGLAGELKNWQIAFA